MVKFPTFAITAFLSFGAMMEIATASVPMNPLPYQIANSDTYPSDFNQAEYFEVYTPLIRTRYSEVFWKTQDPVRLPEEIIQRFENRTMAVVGFEVDQVYHEKGANGSDVSVPITYAFNHHFNAWLLNGRKASIFHKTTYENETGMPLVQAFTHANGGEFRSSYRGFPKGYAQLIDSPDTFRATVMAIDTWNREAMRNNDPKFHVGPLPNFSQSRFNTTTDLDISPLVECPCSDRVEKEGGMSYQLTDGLCKAPVQSASECHAAASQLVQSRKTIVMHIVNTPNGHSFPVPKGCSVEHQQDGTTHAYWKPGQDVSGTDDSMKHAPSDRLIAMAASHWSHSDHVNVTVEVNAVSDLATISLTGPVDRWFAVAFGTHNMCLRLRSDQCPDGGPNAIIVSGDDLMERVLDYHGAGRLIETSVKVESNVVANGQRTVVMTRSLQGKTDDHFSFEFSELATVPSEVPIIAAEGCNLTFSQHCGHGFATLNFLPVEQNEKDRQLTPLCRHGITGTINGAEFEMGHEQRCATFPKSDLTDQHNPTCAIDTYAGGFLCCRDGHSLLDSDQAIPWADQYLEYHLKFRFYFEDYSNETTSTDSVTNSSNLKPSHENMLNFAWMTESNAQEYDTPVCAKGTHPSQCLHVITSRFQVKDMIRDCPTRPDASYCTGTNASHSKGIKLIYASAHCHAGSCHSMELYNADTGRLICQVNPIVGGSDEEIFQERGYIALPPCLFSDNVESGKGLRMPDLLLMNTTLLSIKRVNTTFAHTGEMAMWQMRGLLLPEAEDYEDHPSDVPANEPDSEAEDNAVPSSTNNSFFLALFGFWIVTCFFLAMAVALAFQPRNEANFYFQGEFTDLIRCEDDPMV